MSNQLSLKLELNELLAQADHKLIQYLNTSSNPYFLKSWKEIYGHISLHLFYDYTTHTFAAILRDHQRVEFLPSAKDGFDIIKAPFLSCKTTRSKFISLPPLKMMQFLRKELRYPIIKTSNHGYTIQLNMGGLLGGGAKVSRVHVSEIKVQKSIHKDSKEFLNVHEFLINRYAIHTTQAKDTKDERLIEKLAERIYIALAPDQATDIEAHLAERIDLYEEEYFDEVLLEVLGKSIEQGKPELTDYIRNFSNGKLCIELLRKGYFSKEIVKGGIGKKIVEKILTKLEEETKLLMAKLAEKKAADSSISPKDNFEKLLIILGEREKIEGLLKSLPKTKFKKVLGFIKQNLNLETEDQEAILDGFCSSDSCDNIYEKIISEMLSNKLEMSSSTLEMPNTLLNSPSSSAPCTPASKAVKKVDNISNKQSKGISYLNKVRLSVLSELNLLDHEFSTLVELHNMLKAELDAKNSGLDLKPRSSRNSKLDEIKSLIMSIVKSYRENEANLESNELSSLLPIAFIQDIEVFRAFLEVFLEDFRNDLMFEPKKVRMLSFIIISALKNQDFKEYLRVDDLIVCLKILKPKIEDLGITSENINLQEAINSLNDILFLMGFIGAKGVKGEYLIMVEELTHQMQTHGLEKAFNLFTKKSTDPSLAIKREYAMEAFKRIEGTSFENWTQNAVTV